MKKFATIGAVLLLLTFASTAFAQWDPSLFTVTPEKDCYLVCPSGDLSFSFCISYDGEPLQVSGSNVYMTIVCLEGNLYLCPYECNDKCAYLREPGCYADPQGGAEYSWAFRAGGCCEQLQISLHMKGESTPFYTTTVVMKSPDINGDGMVNSVDEAIIMNNLGMDDVCSDLNCDWIVDGADHQILLSHMNHNCDNWIGTEESTWGEIKAYYNK